MKKIIISVIMLVLNEASHIVILPVAVKTTSRWRLNLGVFTTTLVNWLLMTAYYLGAFPDRVVGWYRRGQYIDPAATAARKK